LDFPETRTRQHRQRGRQWRNKESK